MAVLSSANMTLVGSCSLGENGDGMHVNVQNGYAYIGHQGHSGAGTSIVDVSSIDDPRLVRQMERPAGTHSHKVQVVDDVMLVNFERNKWEASPPQHWRAGLGVFDLSDPTTPREIAFFATPPNGVHRMTYWSPPFAFVSASVEGCIGRILLILDLSRPDAPREVSRWWFPGQNVAAGEKPWWRPRTSEQLPGEQHFEFHHGIQDGNLLYCGWWDGGVVVLDISDIEKPEMLAHVELGPESSETHTMLPLVGRGLAVVTDEPVGRTLGQQRHIRLLDTSDVTEPKVAALMPVPPGDYHARGVRFGPHNLHEHRPGSLFDPDLVYATYFAGGLRVFDVTNPKAPRETAHLIPHSPDRLEGSPESVLDTIQFNDIYVDASRTAFVTDRYGGGLYIITHDV